MVTSEGQNENKKEPKSWSLGVGLKRTQNLVLQISDQSFSDHHEKMYIYRAIISYFFSEHYALGTCMNPPSIKGKKLAPEYPHSSSLCTTAMSVITCYLTRYIIYVTSRQTHSPSRFTWLRLTFTTELSLNRHIFSSFTYSLLPPCNRLCSVCVR